MICRSIPQEIANKFKENPLKKSILTISSPTIPPKGLDAANKKRKTQKKKRPSRKMKVSRKKTQRRKKKGSKKKSMKNRK